MRWKFVENRTVQLKYNAGLTLPSNIGELGDSVTKIDLSDHKLQGELSIRTERLRILLTFMFLAGQLPKELGQLTNLTKLHLNDNAFEGSLRTRSERLNGSLTCNLVCACTVELPLEIIRMKANGVDVALDQNMGFTLPSNIGELGDDITELNLSSCSLTGRLNTRSERIILC